MDDDIKAELARLHEYAKVSEQPFEQVAAETIVTYQRSLRETRRILAVTADALHFARYPIPAEV